MPSLKKKKKKTPHFFSAGALYFNEKSNAKGTYRKPKKQDHFILIKTAQTPEQLCPGHVSDSREWSLVLTKELPGSTQTPK